MHFPWFGLRCHESITHTPDEDRLGRDVVFLQIARKNTDIIARIERCVVVSRNIMRTDLLMFVPEILIHVFMGVAN